VEYVDVNSGKTRNLWAAIGLLAATGGMTGCATTGVQAPPEEAVKLRAQAWADELLAHDFQGAWEFTSPSYRQFTPVDKYKARNLGTSRWTSAKVYSVSCEDDVCDVTLEVEYKIPRLNMSNKRALEYKWLETEGNWWLHVPAK
jgi:hypothetical protein